MKSLRQFFPVVVSAQDVAQGKPAPDIFLRAATLLGVAPETCCVVEDSAAGVTAARAAGMTAIAITNTLPAGKLTHAHHVVRTYEEIERALERDNFLSPEEAKTFGLIDAIHEKRVVPDAAS